MTEQQLAEIEAREKAATPGPWVEWTSNSHWRLSSEEDGRDGGVLSAVLAHDGVPVVAIRQEDGRFIAAARSDVPALLEEVRRLREAGSRVVQTSFGAGGSTAGPRTLGGAHLDALNALHDVLTEK